MFFTREYSAEENINSNEHVDLEHIYVQYQNLFQLENISKIVDQ
jgi:hypothetical protein